VTIAALTRRLANNLAGHCFYSGRHQVSEPIRPLIARIRLVVPKR
jgi:hypothetical protein